MKQQIAALLVVIGLSFGAHAAPLKVVATLPSLAAIAREVGGPSVQVSAMAAATEDPHFVDAKPNLIILLNRADLLVANGLELEIGWLPPLQTAARNGAVQTGAPGYMEAGQSVELREVPTMRIDRAMGDLHPGGNPHFLNEPFQVARIAEAVGRRLGELDPEHADTYSARAAHFAEEMRSLGVAQAARFGALPAAKRQVVAYHKSLSYLLNWLGLTEIGELEPRPGVPPDPAHVAAVLSAMRAKGAQVLVQEEFYPVNTSRTVSQLAKGTLVVLHGGVRFNNGETYTAFFTQMCDTLYAALSK